MNVKPAPASRALYAACAGLILSATSAGAQEQEADLSALFDLGRLVIDTNGDSVPDLVNASLVIGVTPSVTAISAATEISARLGFETMGLDLPIQRGVNGEILIVIGRDGLAASNVESPGVDPTSLDSGEGVVAVREIDGQTWVFVLGGDDEGLLAAARLFAGVLPHTRTLSATSLTQVREDLTAILENSEVSDSNLRLTQARTRGGEAGITRLVVEVDATDVDGATEAFREVADGPNTTEEENDSSEETSPRLLDYSGLSEVEVRISEEAVVRLNGQAEPDDPGPIPSRPGSGAKPDLDLSNLYTSDGLLGGEPIPNRVDAMLVPGESAVGGLPDLGGRLGLESTGLVVPLVERATTLSQPGARPTMVLVGNENRLTDQLADSGHIDVAALEPSEGLIQLVPEAFGSKSSLVITGGDSLGTVRALEQVAVSFPYLGERGKDRPTLEDVEQEVWDALAGYSPVGQSAIGLYKFGLIANQLRDLNLASARVLISVEKADPALAEYVRTKAVSALKLPADAIEIEIDDRDVQNASTIYETEVTIPSETDRFWSLLRDQVLPAVSRGSPVRLEARLSEPPEVREQISAQARLELIEAGADPERTEILVLSAFKQGYSWLYEDVRPRIADADIGEITINFRRNEPPAEWPQQAIHTPIRWLHEIFPIDEILSRELNLDLEKVRFEEVDEGPTYEVLVTDTAGQEILRDTFEPKWVLRPYFDRFQDYEQVRVTTGWMTGWSGDRVLVDERIVTDPESFWDYYQTEVLSALYDHVMGTHEGIPRGGSIDAPFFGELTVDLEMSEPDYRLDLDQEMHTTMDSLHEEIYFGTIEFFDVLGRNSRGQGLIFPGRVIPIMRPKSDGSAGVAHVQITGFATSRPAVVVQYTEASGQTGEVRLDIPKTTLQRPSARLATVKNGSPGLSHLSLRVRVDTELDVRDSLLTYARPEQVDRTMVSAEQIVATLQEIESLRAGGLYTSALAYSDLGSLEVWAEWTHEQDPESRTTGSLAANGVPEADPDWRTLLPDDWSYNGDRLVQWDTPMPPAEGHQVIAMMAEGFPEATAYKVGESYLGKDIWALDLMPAVSASHWSHVKASTFKPTVVYSAREHANEVSSTSHVLRHAELLLTDPEQRAKLNRVNVVIHPYLNPDGAQLAYDLYRITPDYILHAGYLSALGQNATTSGGDDHPILPESQIRPRLWETWLPDVFLNPHGYPSRQFVQLFSEFTGLVRRGRVTERNYGFNKGWFMPGFQYVDHPDFPRHKDAAFNLRDYITRGINSNQDVVDMNQRAYQRYHRYGARFDPEVFRLPMVDNVLIEMPLKGSTGSGNGGYNPRVTIWSGLTEAPDETAYGPWLQLVAKAGLSWDQAILDYLNEGDHKIERSGSSFFGGVSLQMHRPRPPETEEDESEGDEEPPGR